MQARNCCRARATPLAPARDPRAARDVVAVTERRGRDPPIKPKHRRHFRGLRALDTSVYDAVGLPLDLHAAENRYRTHRSPAASLAAAVRPYSRDIVGLLLAALIFGAWLVTLPMMFVQPERVMPTLFGDSRLGVVASTIVLMAARTWITTGLFVTVHDAIHGQVSPSFRRLNHALGAVCSFCYASFSYKLLYRDHWRHHAEPITEGDPDWYEGGLRKWLLSFLGHYSTFWQLFWESFQFWSFVGIGQRVLRIDFSVMVVRVALVWALPALISGLQLFYFGTYLPHKDNPESEHSARSNDWPYLLSLLSCFHFGACHEEHHAYPMLAWWELPEVRAARARARASKL